VVFEQGPGGAGVRQTADCAPHLPAQDRRPAAGHLGWVGGWVGGAVQHGRRLDRGGGCCCVSLPGRLLAGAVGMRDCLPPASRLHARLPICPLAAHPNPLQPSTPCARPTSAWHAVRRGTTCGTGWCRAATGGPCPHASSPTAGTVELYCFKARQDEVHGIATLQFWLLRMFVGAWQVLHCPI
jgi:hypothetical protein